MNFEVCCRVDEKGLDGEEFNKLVYFVDEFICFFLNFLKFNVENC